MVSSHDFTLNSTLMLPPKVELVTLLKYTRYMFITHMIHFPPTQQLSLLNSDVRMPFFPTIELLRAEPLTAKNKSLLSL